MDRQYISLSELAFIFINGPLIIFSFTANIFYACCLIFPPSRMQRLKQPLKMLLGYLVWCSIIYCVSLAFLCCFLKAENNFFMFVVTWQMVLYYILNSMTYSAWLNFYYYVQIVPVRNALLVWMKKNIKFVIYLSLLFDQTLLWVCGAISCADAVHDTSWLTHSNVTWSGHVIYGQYSSGKVCFFAIKGQLLFCLSVMMVSSFSTAHYLHAHMRSVAQGACCSSPKIQSQMRVTITGISQGVLYFLYAAFYFFESFIHYLSSDFSISNLIAFTVSSLYISGTTINFGIGQTVFRQRLANMWKALKAWCGVGMVTHDMETGEIANTVTVNVQMSA